MATASPELYRAYYGRCYHCDHWCDPHGNPENNKNTAMAERIFAHNRHYTVLACKACVDHGAVERGLELMRQLGPVVDQGERRLTARADV